ncbi:MAG: Panacea domain-containing protein [Pirellulaceae bacterium]
MQKLLYLSHMYSLGVHNAPLITPDSFEAWDYGPVIPDLYHLLKAFGANRVGNLFHTVSDAGILPKHMEILKDNFNFFRHKSPGDLISRTHRTGGAWSRAYREGHRTIFDWEIKEEARKHGRRSKIG